MKRHLHTLLLLLGTTISSFGQTSVCLLDSSYHEYAGTTVDYRRFLTYDSEDRITVEVRKEFIDNQWIPVDKKEYTFDANGNQTQMVHSKIDLSNNSLVFFEKEVNTFNGTNFRTQKLSERFSNGAWQPSTRINYTQAVNGNDSIALRYSWFSVINDYQRYDSTVHTWLNTTNLIRRSVYGYSNTDNYYSESSREEFTYNFFGPTVSLITNHKLYNYVQGSFRVVSETRNTYNATGSILSNQLFQPLINSTTAMNSATYSYDDNERLIELIRATFNPATNLIGPSSRHLYTYNANDRIQEERRFTYVQSQGVFLAAIDSNTYHANGKIASVMTYGISNNAPNDNNSLRTYTYNNDDQLTQLKTENYTGQTPGSLVSQQDFFYCFEPQLSITNVSVNTLTVYPNPVVNKLNFIAPANGSATLLSITGKMIFTVEMIQGENSINLEDLESGMYILKMDNGLEAKIVKK